MDGCIESLGDATIFSALDAKRSYSKVQIAKGNKEETAFAPHYGLLQFIPMQCGLKKAPATLQRDIAFILSTVDW